MCPIKLSVGFVKDFLEEPNWAWVNISQVVKCEYTSLWKHTSAFLLQIICSFFAISNTILSWATIRGSSRSKSLENPQNENDWNPARSSKH